jgi:predicted N-acetyltransferase YhbS
VSADPVFGPEPLAPSHAVEGFDCGVASLNRYLVHQALHDQRAEKSRTYVVCRGERVIGYFTLTAASVEPKDATERATKGQGGQAIPAILLGRLAVQVEEQGKRFGEALLGEALLKTASAADSIGARVLLVHAAGDSAKSFYLRYGFEPSPSDPLHLMLLMKDLRKTIDELADAE